MAKLLGLLFACLIVHADSWAQITKEQYTVKGKVKGLPDGSKVILIKPIKKGVDTIASALVKNGTFEINGELGLEGEGHFLALDTLISKNRILIFLVHNPITISGTLDQWPEVIINGSAPTNDYHRLLKMLKPLKSGVNKKKMDLLNARMRLDSVNKGILPMEDTAMLALKIQKIEYEELEATNKYYKEWANFIKQHPNSLYTPLSIMKMNYKLEEMMAAYSKLDEDVKRSFYGVELNAMIENKNMLKNIKIGSISPNFSSKDVKGQDVSLKDILLKGKITLIDFWASWCKPCRQQIPYIKKTYEAFHKNGFNVLGVALEFSRANWEKALAEDNTPWFQVSQIEGRDETAVQMFGVNGIPAYLLINEDGKIIALDLPGSIIQSTPGSLHGEKLYSLVDSLLGNKRATTGMPK